MFETSSFTAYSTGLMLTALAGAATPLGGLLAVLVSRKRVFRVWAFGLGLSAGVMVYLSMFDLLPEAMALTGQGTGLLSVPLFFVLGLAVTWLADLVTHRWVGHCNPDDMECHLGETSLAGRDMKRVGLVAVVAITLHNFPEGIATFVTASADLKLGLQVAAAIALHNLPEGFCVAMPVLCATGRPRRALLLSLVAGLAEPLGAVIAWLFLAPLVTPDVLAWLFAAVAGIMVYVAVDELIPAGRRLSQSHECLTGMVAGMVLMLVGMNLLK
jgi:ZIP family zinc transporter